MALEFLNETHYDVLNKLNEELQYIDDIDTSHLNDLSVMRLSVILEALDERIDEAKRDKPYGSWLNDSKYVRDTILHDIVETLIGVKEAKMEEEKILVGESYYTRMARSDGLVGGYKAYVTKDDIHGWIPILENEDLLKIMEVLKVGDVEDFRNIYVGMANGRQDGLANLSFDHIAQSTPDAITEMVEYCESRWDSPWPWEIEAPEKLKHVIEYREEKKMNQLNEMYERMNVLLREFEEIHMNQFELVTAAQDMMKRVDGMITDLGKLSSSGIEVMAKAKASGDENVGPMQNALGEPLNAAVEALTDLKAALTMTMKELSGEEMEDMETDDEMGSPADRMGSRPSKDDIDVDDLSIDGDESERPTKEF